MRSSNKNRINRQINVAKVRLIDEKGGQVGVVSLDEALQYAEKAELDLVELSPDAEPPVCRIMDYGKFTFDINKKKTASKKKQKQTQVKEIKFRPTTEEADYQVKLRNLKKFLAQGDKAKISLRFRGREMMHQQLGMELMRRLQSDLELEGVVEHQPKLEGRQITMVVAPKK